MADRDCKWTCEKCTYENYFASKRCSVCGFSVNVNTFNGVDIYNLACQQPVRTKTSTTDVAVTSDLIPNQKLVSQTDKWACSVCTLLNAVWAESCSACNSPRNPDCSYSSSNQIAKSNSSCSPPSRVVRAGSGNSISTTTSRLASYLPKWRCANCTYDNYPKSQKCSMCQKQKPSSMSSEPYGGKSAMIEQVAGHTPDSISPHPSPQGSVANLNEACAVSSTRLQSHELLKSSASSSSYSDMRRQISPPLSPSHLFANACKSICEGSSEDAINLFLLCGGDPRQKVTPDELDFIGADGGGSGNEYVGQSLFDLAVTYKRENVVRLLLDAIDNLHTQHFEVSRRKTTTQSSVASPRRRNALPCQVCHDLAADVRFLFGAGLRQAKEGAFPCYYFARDPVTFSLPPEIHGLPHNVKKQLLEDIIDHQVQCEIESEAVVNWSNEVVFNLGSRLFALKNRAAGDCLLDSVMQTMWGVMDRSNVLRRAMASGLYEAQNAFLQCWRNYESALNERLGFTLEESQWEAAWMKILDLANSQGQSLEELHVFVLAHVLRRPIIVYSPNFVRSRISGDKIGESSFQGVYLPILWDRQFCHRNPIALAYTLGHFSALVALQSDETTIDPRGSGEQAVYLPLQDADGKLFPVHFSSPRGPTSTKRLLTDWLDCWKTCRTNILVAQQRLEPPPIAVRQMLTEWLSRYSNSATSLAENAGQEFIEISTLLPSVHENSIRLENINLTTGPDSSSASHQVLKASENENHETSP